VYTAQVTRCEVNNRRSHQKNGQCTIHLTKLKLNSVALVCERTIPAERPLPVSEVSANTSYTNSYFLMNSHSYTLQSVHHILEYHKKNTYITAYSVCIQCIYTVYVYSVCIQCIYTVYVYSVRTQCTYTLYVYIVCIQCIYIVYVDSVCIQCMYTVYVYSVRIHCIQCMYTVYVYIVCIQCTYTEYVYSVRIHCMYTVYVHSVCIQCMYTVYVYIVRIQCMYTEFRVHREPPFKKVQGKHHN
jgi:hypothetical protein